MRARTIVAVSAGVAFAIATTSAAATNQSLVAGGCQVQAKAALTPGLALNARPFHYSYTGTLGSCFYTGSGGATGGVISAGRPITIDGRAYQEPVPTGTGTCLITSAEGYDFARWNNGTQTIVKFTTTSMGGVTHLTGSVIPSLPLNVLRPAAGQPTSAIFRTTNFNGQSVAGVLEFHASDPSLCAKPHGLTTATITGVLSHTGVAPAVQTTPPATPTFTDAHCRSPSTHTYVLNHARGTRVTDVRVYVNGTLRLERRGHALPRVTVRRIKPGQTVRIVIRQSNGRRRARTYRYRPCPHSPSGQTKPMRLGSPAFNEAGQLPASATCTGGATSPALQWRNVPTGTQDLELLVTDPDAPGGTVSHWVVYNIPKATNEFPAGSVPAGAQQGMNSFGTKSYLPPCPLPPGSTHQYVFELFASKQKLRFGHAPTDSEVRKALQGNVLATATLIGTYALTG